MSSEHGAPGTRVRVNRDIDPIDLQPEDTAPSSLLIIVMIETLHYPKKIWASLLTNEGYVRAVLTFHHSLVKSGTKYPFYAIVTEVVCIVH